MEVGKNYRLSVEDELIERDRAQNKFMQIQAEKNLYLGEYKERVIIALTKDQITRGEVYPEVIEIMKSDKHVFILKMSREVPIKKLRPYIALAEMIELNYTVVDSLSYHGDIGLVIAAEDALEKQREHLIPGTINSDLIDNDLEEYLEFIGEKICSVCLNELAEVLPERVSSFKSLTFVEVFFGKHCPKCGERRK